MQSGGSGGRDGASPAMKVLSAVLCAALHCEGRGDLSGCAQARPHLSLSCSAPLVGSPWAPGRAGSPGPKANSAPGYWAHRPKRAACPPDRLHRGGPHLAPRLPTARPGIVIRSMLPVRCLYFRPRSVGCVRGCGRDSVVSASLHFPSPVDCSHFLPELLVLPSTAAQARGHLPAPPEQGKGRPRATSWPHSASNRSGGKGRRTPLTPTAGALRLLWAGPGAGAWLPRGQRGLCPRLAAAFLPSASPAPAPSQPGPTLSLPQTPRLCLQGQLSL